MAKDLNDLKKQIFFELLDLAGRVFIVVTYSDNVVIGNRGFLPEEKERGLVLVFNRMMQFAWDDTGIHATLGFGPKVEKCFIPPDEIKAIFSPELEAQFATSSEKKDHPEPSSGHDTEKKPEGKPSLRAVPDKKVVKVDFSKKK
ncbi:MAG: hypothetical protein M0024_07850 [Nitrospiraceae bacterium]|nr:hypothetical protein [Nitrospiraceae bacterium]